MENVLSWFIATFVTLPILGYFIVFISVKQFTRNHRLAVKWALDSSTILFVFSVHYLILVIWEVSYLWAIFLVLIGIAICFVLIHWKTKEEIQVGKALRGFWRFSFLVFFSAYMILLIYGLVTRVTTYVSMP